MKKIDVVKNILQNRFQKFPQQKSAKAFAPTNIALCKYWGKRNQELNLPVTSSLSISLGNKGATTELIVSDQLNDNIFLNSQAVDLHSSFAKRLIDFLNIFRAQGAPRFTVHIESTVPIAAGLASSACGFAALVKSLNDLYGWQLTDRELSILARLGSGSAARSIWQGFVEWHAGVNVDGSDSYAEPLAARWPELCVGLLILSEKEKLISSREAMQRTVATSPLYAAWPQKVAHDLSLLKQAIAKQDFALLGSTAESNAMNMHATMLSAWPPVMYFLPETLQAMQKVWQLRSEGISIYFTQDAGPNLKLLFLQKDAEQVRQFFPDANILLIFP